MWCIYCKNRNAARGREHVYPEALGQHDWLLPAGAVCDSCNSYLGELDQAIAANGHIRMALWWFRVRGKSGKPRREIPDIRWTDDANIHVDAPAKRVRETIVDHEQKRIFQCVDEPRDVRPDRFRRGLYKIAFNVCAIHLSTEAMLDTEYDDVRRYIRRPHRSERWPYVQRPVVADLYECTELQLRLQIFGSATGRWAALHLLTDEYFVSLLHPLGIVDVVKAAIPNVSMLVHHADDTATNLDGDVIPPPSPADPNHPWNGPPSDRIRLLLL